jgi:Holliday junction resolvase RusA-like endonuclease
MQNMAKRKFKLSVRIPEYQSPRNLWRQKLHNIILSAANQSGIFYQPSDKLDLKIKLYMNSIALSFHDVDNRLKDIMDALQGRAGGSKKIRRWAPIIPNDKQIYCVTIEKSLPPKQSKGLWHLVITKHKDI